MLFNLEKPQGNSIFFELIFSIIGKAKSNDHCCAALKKIKSKFSFNKNC